MKIYSWNILRSNKNLEEAYRFIEALEFDVLCLQEVTEEMLMRFQSMPFHIAYGADKRLQRISLFPRLSKRTQQKIPRGADNYLVILTKHSIEKSESFPIPEGRHTFISRVSEYILALLTKRERVSDTHALCADIKIGISPESVFRIFCVHLLLWTPELRAQQFKAITEHQTNENISIYCGDFNVLEWWPITILNGMFGGKLYEVMPWYSERKQFEKRLAQLNLQNPLCGTITHPFSHSQLDHILLPKGHTVLESGVLEERHGSDHCPVFVEVTTHL